MARIERTGARSGSSRPWYAKSYSRWDDYTRARDETITVSDTSWAPWFVAQSDKKRLNIITHSLSRIPYEEVPHKSIKLPNRQKLDKYKSPDYPFKFIPEVI